jgi:hypothetical protein
MHRLYSFVHFLLKPILLLQKAGFIINRISAVFNIMTNNHLSNLPIGRQATSKNQLISFSFLHLLLFQSFGTKTVSFLLFIRLLSALLYS